MDVKKSHWLTLFILGILSGNSCFADSVLEYQRTAATGKTTPIYAYIRGNLVYLPEINPNPKIDLVFDQSNSLFTVIDHSKQRYSQFTEANINQLIEQSQNAISAMQSLSQQLGQLSPGLQESLGNMLPQNNASAQNYSYQWLKKYKQFAGYQCQTALVVAEEKAVAAVCIAKDAIQKTLQQDYTPIAEMLEIAKRLSNQSRNLASVLAVKVPQLGADVEGVPLEVIDGLTNITIQLKQITTSADLSSLKIQIPTGYRKVSLMVMAAAQS